MKQAALKPVIQETLKLVGVVENQSRELLAFCGNEQNLSANFSDYKRFVEKMEHFYVFVDLVDGRIPEFDESKQKPLRKHLSKIRWKITILELDTTRIYLINITRSGRRLPLGSREFLMRRLDRLSEIAQYYDRFGEEYELAPPISEELIESVRQLLKEGIEKAPRLEEFQPAPPPPRLSATPSMSSPSNNPVTPAAGALLPPDMVAARHASSAHASSMPSLPAKLNVKEQWGRFFVEKGSIVAVSQACKMAALSLDQLAQRIGVSRVALTLMLSGQDPMPRPAMEKLQQFMMDQARLSQQTELRRRL
ncbi:hypothetical protein FNB15_14785 [Ferrovibrio terrae]|uniref:Uncharacterized protein n=1 Tax=Ferrovibrio terrae TaxID=2594003 RepID=A0A516H3Z9_9PROT|nr:hypothetical protein [Ferrovibrio terrae]QDO98465.1 hypothetical protein FNB15_14785 [Ferrovibrio terrae]